MGKKGDRMSNHSDHRMVSRRELLRHGGRAAMAIAALPLVAGCTVLSATDDNRYVVIMTPGNRFSPAGMSIPVGATVVWRNMDVDPHTSTTRVDLLDDPDRVSLPEGADPWHSGDVLTGAQWSHTFTEPGTYLYACAHHQASGMIGTITVTDDGSATPVSEVEST